MSKSFHDHFSNVASRYAEFRPRYPAALFDWLATLVPQSDVVWDCAAGNGQASMDLAERFARVVAADASAEQIASAKPHPKIEFRVAPAEQSGLADESVGLITVAQALHWFDRDRFYGEVRRVLKPGGVLAVWAYGVNRADDAAIDNVIFNFYENVVGPYWPPERKLVEEGYRTITFPFVEIVSTGFCMEAHWTLEELTGYFSTWSATNRFIKATGRNPLEPLTNELRKVWGDAQRARRIEWPLAVRVGRK